MIDELGGTLTLTEVSSRELMRVLKEQDVEFMDALFNGECGFTLKCTDGRSVELVPKADRKTEPQTDCDNCMYLHCNYECGEDEPQTEMTTEQIANELLSIKKILDDGKMPKQR